MLLDLPLDIYLINNESSYCKKNRKIPEDIYVMAIVSFCINILVLLCLIIFLSRNKIENGKSIFIFIMCLFFITYISSISVDLSAIIKKDEEIDKTTKYIASINLVLLFVFFTIVFLVLYSGRVSFLDR